MSNSPSSPGWAHYGCSQSPTVQRYDSELARMDAALAGEGAWTQNIHSKKRKPQYKNATVSSARIAKYTGVTANNELFDKDLLLADTWACPSNIHLNRAQATSFNTNIVQTDESTHATTLDFSYHKPNALIEEDLAARQLTSTAIAGLHQPNLTTNNEVHQWLPIPTGHRFANPAVAQDDGRGPGHRKPTCEAGSESSSWVFASATFYDVDRGNQGTRNGAPLASDNSYSTWIDVDHNSEANLHHSA